LAANVENLTLTGASNLSGTGNGEANVITGNSGNNVLNGGSGTDAVSYANATAAVTVNLSTTGAQSTGGAGSDTLSAFENLTGSGFNDTLTGDGNANILTGLAGNDSMNGAAGADTLIGSAGNDTLTGGTGNDTFVFKAGFGQDIVTDFTAGAASDDVIEFHDGQFADVAAILAAAGASGSDTVITVDAVTKITLQNIALANLHQDDFRVV
jgi:Ca2+-binding RTX toxin-like protein